MAQERPVGHLHTTQEVVCAEVGVLLLRSEVFGGREYFIGCDNTSGRVLGSDGLEKTQQQPQGLALAHTRGGGERAIHLLYGVVVAHAASHKQEGAVIGCDEVGGGIGRVHCANFAS